MEQKTHLSPTVKVIYYYNNYERNYLKFLISQFGEFRDFTSKLSSVLPCNRIRTLTDWYSVTIINIICRHYRMLDGIGVFYPTDKTAAISLTMLMSNQGWLSNVKLFGAVKYGFLRSSK